MPPGWSLVLGRARLFPRTACLPADGYSQGVGTHCIMQLKAPLVGSVVALSVALVALQPAPAFAAKKHASLHTPTAEYPMKADAFRKATDTRIERLWGAIEKKLERRSVSAERKKSLRKMFDEAAQETRAQVTKATADGIVTQAEGDQVKRLALGIRLRLRERIRAEKLARTDPNVHVPGKNGHSRRPKKEAGPSKSTSTRSAVASRPTATPSEDDPYGHESSTRPSDPTREP